MIFLSNVDEEFVMKSKRTLFVLCFFMLACNNSTVPSSSYEGITETGAIIGNKLKPDIHRVMVEIGNLKT